MGFGLAGDELHFPPKLFVQTFNMLKENNFPISEIGRRLKVNNLIDGTIFIQGNDINIDVRLLDINSGAEIWVKHFNGMKNTTGELIHNIIYSVLTHFLVMASCLIDNKKT